MNNSLEVIIYEGRAIGFIWEHMLVYYDIKAKGAFSSLTLREKYCINHIWESENMKLVPLSKIEESINC